MEVYMEEQEQNMTKEEKTEKMPKAMVEIQADEFSADEIPAAQTEESSADPSDSVTEILVPENKEMSVKEETAVFESGEADRSGADQDGSDMYGEQDAENSADPVSDTPSDSFEENTMYVRTDGSREEAHTMEHASEDGTSAATARSEENSYDQTVRYAEDPHDRNFRSEEDSYRQKSGSGEDLYGRDSRSFEDTYRRDGGMDADWRRRASRTNDTSGNFDSEREDRNNEKSRGPRYSSSYDHYRFETPGGSRQVDKQNSFSPEDDRKPASGKKKKGNRGWIAAGIAAAVLAAGFFLFFGIRAFLMTAVNVARTVPDTGAQAGPEAGAEAEAPAEEPEIVFGNQDKKTDTPQTAGRADTETTGGNEDMTVPEVVQMCLPSMVAITNTTVEEYRDYFGGTRTYENVSAGSGIIIGGSETELLIATNNHVIANSSDITVTFIDDTVCPGTIKGQASDEDLAIISVSLADISAETREKIAIVAIGNSDELQVGETVVAIGNALGYGQSVSRGVVSALNRDVTVDGVTHTLIQTDASINPGNSGGALLNLRGELIGINEVKYVNTDVEGIGYAIPINVAEPILTNLGSRAKREKVSDEDRAYIGIKCVGVNSEYVQYGYPAGVYVSEVTPGGPAEQAGLRTGDIVTAIDGVPVSTTDQLLDNLEYFSAGETIEFSVSRQGEQPGSFETTKIPITLGRRSESGLDDPAEGGSAAAPEENSGNEERNDWGFPTLPE